MKKQSTYLSFYLFLWVFFLPISERMYAQNLTGFSIEEINPTFSTFDRTDPNSAAGGRVNGLGITADGTTLYAASEWGGLWKSTDRGKNWSYLPNHLPQACWDVEVNPANPRLIYATSFYDGLVTGSRSGLNISRDGGKTWSKPPSFIPPAGLCSNDRINEPRAYGISIDPENHAHIFVGTNCGLAMSLDSGLSWTFIDPTPVNPADDIWDIVVHHGGIIDLVGDDGHQRSTNNGRNWTTANRNPLPSGRASIAVSPDESYVLFAVVGKSRVFESDSAGASWHLEMLVPDSNNRIPFAVSNKLSNNRFNLWVGTNKLFRTQCSTPQNRVMGGARRCPANNWSADLSKPRGAHNDAGDLIFDPTVAQNACPIAFSCDGGVYTNLDTSAACQTPNWEQARTTTRALWLFGLGGSELPGLNDEHVYFGCQDNGSFGMDDAGASDPEYTMADCCDGFDVAAETDKVLYSICCGSPRETKLRKRQPGLVGGAVMGENDHPRGLLPGFRYIDAIANFGEDDYVVATDSGVFISTNIDASPVVWTKIGAASLPNPLNIRGVKASRKGANHSFYLLKGNGRGFAIDSIWRFNGTNPNSNWTLLNRPNNTGGFGLFDVDPKNPERIIASYIADRNANPQMLITHNGGATWNNLPELDSMMTDRGRIKSRTLRGRFDFSFAQNHVQPSLVAFSPHDSNLIVAGAIDAGLFYSFNRGQSWTRVSFPSSFLTLIKSPSPFGGISYLHRKTRPVIPRPVLAYFEKPVQNGHKLVYYVYVGTVGRGLWRLKLEKVPLGFCERNPQACTDFPFAVGGGWADISVRPETEVIHTDLPRICQFVVNCPGCDGFSLCPPHYQLHLDSVDYDSWEPSLLNKKDGSPLILDVWPLPGGTVINFRPEKKMFRMPDIGDYTLVLTRKKGARNGSQKMRLRVTASETPYQTNLKIFDAGPQITE